MLVQFRQTLELRMHWNGHVYIDCRPDAQHVLVSNITAEINVYPVAVILRLASLGKVQYIAV